MKSDIIKLYQYFERQAGRHYRTLLRVLHYTESASQCIPFKVLVNDPTSAIKSRCSDDDLLIRYSSPTKVPYEFLLGT